MTQALNYFDQILYINLNHRKDRRHQILQELQRLNVDLNKVYCIQGYYDLKNGHRGCTISHIKALEYAIEHACKNVLILEDDCLFDKDVQMIHRHIHTFFETVEKWDVFFLGTNIHLFQETQWENIFRVIFSTCAMAYCVNAPYLPKLLNCYYQVLEMMEDIPFFSQSPVLDANWIRLQLVDKWYIGKKTLAYQADTKSDIRNQMSEDSQMFFKLEHIQKLKPKKIFLTDQNVFAYLF